MATYKLVLVVALMLVLLGRGGLGDRPIQFDPLAIKDMMYKSKSPQLKSLRASPYNVSSQCAAEISRLLNGDPKTMATDAIMALDAFGKPPAGILQMNFAWLGHYDECMAIEDFNYCLVDMAVNMTMFKKNQSKPGVGMAFGGLPRIDIRWGICPPTNCSEGDIHAVLTHLLESLKILDSLGIPSRAISEAGVVCTKEPPILYSAGFFIAVTVCCIIAFLMVFGALYDEYVNFMDRNPRGPALSSFSFRKPWKLLDDTVHDDDDDDDENILIINNGSPGLPINSNTHSSKQQSLAIRILLCFALNRNMAKLMNVKQGDSSISALNGIRVISMFWVIIGHTVFFGFVANITDNILKVLDQVQNHVGFQALANAFFSVDSFFFLSGFLLAYLTFDRFAELRTVKRWALFYFHRWWRLTPLFAFTILIWMYIPQFFGEGPIWQTSTSRELCPKYWWSSLLYIGNFWPTQFGQQCIGWTWYLANDMQFFVISPLLMVPLYYFPLFGWLTMIATLIASFISTGLIIGVYDLKLDFISQLGGTNDYSSLVYGKPYCRIAPYLVGIGLGYIMHRIGKRKLKMSPMFAVIGWLVAAGLAMSAVYGLYPVYHSPPMTKAATIVYGSISRFVWALALAWVVFACKYGYGGWINTFLSWGGWVPLARVTFSAYMIHPIVLEVFFANFATTWHFSVYLTAFYFAGAVSVSYFVAIFVSLAVEYPFANLEKLLIPTPPRAKKTLMDNQQTSAGNGVEVVRPPAKNTPTVDGRSNQPVTA